MALRKVKATVDRVLEKNLQDLVRGIRNSKDNEAKFIAECIEEIKLELKLDNVAIKAVAINKLIYLEMLGYDVSWAAFNVIEVMSSPKFTHKRIGYLAAAQSFHAGTDVLMLTTNMIRKDLCSAQLYDVGVALSGLSCFLSPDLARDIANDVMTLMTSSKPYVRKKSILLLYKVFLCYPDALRVAFPRLKERLEDADAGVQAAAINVIGELARKNPKNYLSLAPVFFKLMTTSTSNWVLIKIIKLFAALTPLEPRLGKKLIEPLTNLIHSTSAMSLLYECINTVIAVLISITSAPGVSESAQSSAVQTQLANLCVQKLRILIEDSDQNLKYLGLLAMGRILKTHPKTVQAHKDMVLGCLDDKDESIRLRALDLLYGMVSKKTLMEIVKKLLQHAEKAEGTFYRDELLAKVIDLCSQNNYQFVTNFEWYVSVLVDLTRIESTRHGALIAAQMLDVAIRVPSVRAFAVSQMAVLIENAHLVIGVSNQAQSPGGVCEVFYAAAFLCAEFHDYLNEASKTLTAMLRPKISIFPGHIQSVFVHNALKLWAKLVARAVTDNDAPAFAELTKLVRDRLSQLVQNSDLEVQERASVFEQLVLAVDKLSETTETESGTESLPSQELADELAALFGGDLNPVAPKAQKKVPVPEGLDLDKWINEPPAPTVTKSNLDFAINSKQSSPGLGFSGKGKATDSLEVGATSFSSSAATTTGSSASISTAQRIEPSNEELVKMREHRLMEQQANPHYLKLGASANKSPSHAAGTASPAELNLPSNSNEFGVSNSREIAGLVSSDKFLLEQRRASVQQETAPQKGSKGKKGKANAKAKGKKGKRASDRLRKESETEQETPVVVLSQFEAPEGVADEADEKKSQRIALPTDDPHLALAEINLDEPLKVDEYRLPVRQHRSDAQSTQNDASKQQLKIGADKPAAAAPAAASLKSEKVEKEKENGKEKKTKKGKAKKLAKADRASEEPIISFDDPADASATTPVPVAADANNTSAGATADASPSQQTPTATPEKEQKTAKKEEPKVKSNEAASPKKKATKKKDGEKQGKSKTKSKANRQQSDDRDRDRTEYEQTFEDLLRGEKQSQQNAVEQLLDQSRSSNQQSNRFASYRLLAENSTLKLLYQIRVQQREPQQFSLALGFVNQAAAGGLTLRKFEFNVLDTMNVKLCRDASAGTDAFNSVPLAFQLPAASSQDCLFTFTVESISVGQKLRGTVSYFTLSAASSSTGSSQEKLDFVLPLPSSAFLLGSTDKMDTEQFAALLSSGDLVSKYATSVKVDDNPSDFAVLLDRVTTCLRLQVVERVDNTASLHGRTMQRHDICVLLKYAAASSTLTIEGKTSDSSLVSSIVDEIKNCVVSASSNAQT